MLCFVISCSVLVQNKCNRRHVTERLAESNSELLCLSSSCISLAWCVKMIPVFLPHVLNKGCI
jgi:hypothetical protein